MPLNFDIGAIFIKKERDNNFCKLGDIKNEHVKELITRKVLKSREDCPVGPYANSPLEDVDVVIPKDSAPIVKEVLDSPELKEFIKINYEQLKSGKILNGSIEFARPAFNMDAVKHPIKTNDIVTRFSVLHNIDIVDAKLENDGTITMKLLDYYDFSKFPENQRLLPDNFEQIKQQGIGKTLSDAGKAIMNNKINRLNNRAYNQKLLGKLKPYIIYKEIKIKIT